MTLDPTARRVHERRRHAYLDGSHELCTGVKRGVEHRGQFELLYGYPTDVDAVWRDREREEMLKQRKEETT